MTSIRSFIELEDHFSGNDDAQSVHFISFDNILNGKAPIAFSHIYFIMEAFKQLNFDEMAYPLYIQKFELLFKCSIYRNTQIIIKVNECFSELNEKSNKQLKLLTITDLMKYIVDNKELLETEATNLGINISHYMNIDNDDIDSCTNDFCRNQKLDSRGSACDNVIIIKNGNGDLYLLTIVRKFGPGRNNYALSGGFCENKESTIETAKRELKEEVLGVDSLDNLTSSTVIEFEIDKFFSNFWDPRGKFPLGMEVGAYVRYIELNDTIE